MLLQPILIMSLGEATVTAAAVMSDFTAIYFLVLAVSSAASVAFTLASAYATATAIHECNM